MSSNSPYLDPASIGSSVSPQQQQQLQGQHHHTSSQGLADWMSSSFLPQDTTNNNTGASSSSHQQQQQQPYASSSSSGSRAFGATSPFPPAPPYPSTFSSLSMPYKPPPDALPIMDPPPLPSGSNGGGNHSGGSGGGGGGGQMSMGDLSLSSGAGSGRSNAFDLGPFGMGPGQDVGPNGILKAVTDQVGYLEGESGEPYLKLYYYRVVRPALPSLSSRLR